MIEVKQVNEILAKTELPKRETENSAGFDLRYAGAENEISLKVGETKVIPTNYAWRIPEGYVGLVCSRSGLAAKNNVFVLNAPGVVDSDYRGEVKVILTNLGDKDYIISWGDRIAQMVVVPYYTYGQRFAAPVAEFELTTRGAGGFGSTGVS